MTAVDTRSTRVAFFGRVADELTRQDLSPRQFRATLASSARRAVQKEDGYFVFVDLPASPPSYDVDLTGDQFQPRRLSVAAPAVGTTEVIVAGEDELHVIVLRIDLPDRIEFAVLPFVPSVPQGVPVLSSGGAATTLLEPLEGVAIDGAELATIAGVAVDDTVRIVRSSRLLLRPGPYYPFPADTTVAAIHVVESTAGAEPIPGVQLQITQVNGAVVTSTMVAGATLFRTTSIVIGTDAARTALSNARGDAVFYYPSNTPVTALTLSVSKAGYLTQAVSVVVQPQARTSTVVQLVRS
jgi:hypothetical protein